MNSAKIAEVAFDEDIAPDIFRLEEPPAEERHDRPQYPPSTCSFCGEEKDRLIVGKPAYICAGCADKSADIAWPQADSQD